MDIEAIDKIVDRKRLIEDVDQEKVSRENKEIIKLQVAQDTACSEQKEKLADFKSEHERLRQRRSCSRQLSNKNQEDLRRRPEILNRWDKVKRVAQQCMDDAVSDLQQLQWAKTRVNELQEKLKGMKEQQDQLRDMYKEVQLQVQALCSQLEVARSEHELAAAIEDTKKKLEAAIVVLDKAQSQAGQFASFERDARGETAANTGNTKAPKRARADAPGTSMADEAARRNEYDPPAADAFMAGSKTTT